MKKSKVSEDYILHTSVAEFNLLMFDLILDNKIYGEVDYRILYEKNGTSFWYLTKSGYEKAGQIGKQLLDDSFFHKIISDAEKLKTSLETYEVADLNSANIINEWNRYISLFKEFCRIYIFLEQPFQHKLEDIILRYISEKELVRLLSENKGATIQSSKINNKAKDILNKILELGEIKLGLHISSEKFMTTDWMKLISFVAKNSYVPTQIAEALRFNEIKKAIYGTAVDIVAIKKRLSGCALVKRNGKWYFESGNRYLYWENKIKKNQSEEIIGKVAFPGVVRGKVVLHQSWTGTTVINEGDILVTGMTNPQMIPYIKKAGAIVTDEGGITCHAAIISREMKKPCITGTKNATQLLKNGDLVEVDANNGIVKIIK